MDYRQPSITVQEYQIQKCHVLVDKQYDFLLKKIWVTSHGYVKFRHEKKDVYLHRYIMNIQDKNIKIDHKNGNKLDNRRENLRICTQSENCRNKRIRKDNKSGMTGIYWRKNRNKWQVQICLNGTRYTGGCHDDLFSAIKSRMQLANKIHGEFADINGVLKI